MGFGLISGGAVLHAEPGSLHGGQRRPGQPGHHARVPAPVRASEAHQGNTPATVGVPGRLARLGGLDRSPRDTDHDAGGRAVLRRRHRSGEDPRCDRVLLRGHGGFRRTRPDTGPRWRQAGIPPRRCPTPSSCRWRSCPTSSWLSKNPPAWVRILGDVLPLKHFGQGVLGRLPPGGAGSRLAGDRPRDPGGVGRRRRNRCMAILRLDASGAARPSGQSLGLTGDSRHRRKRRSRLRGSRRSQSRVDAAR